MRHFGSLPRAWWALVVIAALALVSLACGGTTTVATEPPVQVQPTAGPVDGGTTTGLSFVIENAGGAEICYIYMVEASSDPLDWGPDQLGENTIASGDSFTLTNLPAGIYDIKTEDCDGNVLSWNYGQTVDQDGMVLSVSGATDQLVIVNNSSLNYCQVYLSPGDSDNWGRPQISEETRVDSGVTRRIAASSLNAWDLRAVPCEGGDEQVQDDVAISGEITWTFEDQ